MWLDYLLVFLFMMSLRWIIASTIEEEEEKKRTVILGFSWIT